MSKKFKFLLFIFLKFQYNVLYILCKNNKQTLKQNNNEKFIYY